MTAGFDAMRWTDQRFSDALSGADGTWDPAVTMPVLDVFPDALSAPMPAPEAGSIPIVPALGSSRGSPAKAARPAGATQSGGRVPPAARGQVAGGRTVRETQQTRPAQPARPVPQTRTAPAASPTAIRPVAPSPANASSALRILSDRIGTWTDQNKIAQSDVFWNGRQQVVPQSTRPAAPQRAVAPAQRPANAQRTVASQQYRPAPARTSAQSQASASPTEVAPAAPTVSQYGPIRQIRNQSQLRRATRSPRQARKARGQSVLSVLLFLVIVLFATGVGQRIFDAVTALIQR